ncbi:MAG: hypothetical protein J7647_29450 [Cyanobacteria bacterium SBLK]|nr:hypothetical protein [Cyanobacteria bacterium SBLK]
MFPLIFYFFIFLIIIRSLPANRLLLIERAIAAFFPDTPIESPLPSAGEIVKAIARKHYPIALKTATLGAIASFTSILARDGVADL